MRHKFKKRTGNRQPELSSRAHSHQAFVLFQDHPPQGVVRRFAQIAHLREHSLRSLGTPERLKHLSMIVGANDYFVENGMKIGQTHAAIIDALERGNAELAKKCLRENIMEPLQQIIAKV